MKHHQDPLPDMTRLEKDEQGLKVIEPKDVPVKLVDGQLYEWPDGRYSRYTGGLTTWDKRIYNEGSGRFTDEAQPYDRSADHHKAEDTFVHPLDRDEGWR